MQSLKRLAIIPARIGSTRFPKKVVQPILKKPMIAWVYERARASQVFDAVWVATDSEEVKKIVEEIGGEAFLTPSDLPSGTDRVAWLLKERNVSVDIVVNIQGDEPLISEVALERLVKSFELNPMQKMATLFVRKSDPGFHDPQIVKAVRGNDGYAADFFREARSAENQEEYLKHIGIYAFTPDTLFEYTSLSPTVRERELRLEQIRALDNNIPIYLVESSEDTVAVDVAEDIEKVERKLKESMIGF